ncbi:serine hydrolase [Sporolactobacillus sp. Y61]|uniref:serine-type D-Ala-D-Ala carboxypeptidase n=1 Tax=Sporolactobacillus sp. Y61 TaxID=3160863 RepID=A0AAU8IHT0_9BACL|nr:serine hydrolase [Sporolactobacillus sp. THM19-2]RYL94188.1 D-alanyl-D-alanine carboxypeptidase [Sporolactobacillus sp. THM19-2]
MNFRKSLRFLVAASLALVLVVALSFQNQLTPKAQAEDTVGIKAKSAILIDVNSGQILYEKNADQVYPPASMTKIMTEYLVMQALNQKKLTWDTKVSISDYAYQISQNREFSNVPLRKDYQYTVRELYEAMAIYSANGATIALAEKIGGSEKNFVDLMNKTAKKLGMTHASYINSSGLENIDLGDFAPYGDEKDSNLLSARDLAKLAYHMVRDYPEALTISSIPLKNFTAGVDSPVQMVNWNYMLPGFGANMNQYKYEGVDGLKTGHTDLAGYCFTGTVNRDGHRLASVIMGTPSENERFGQTRALFDYGYQQFSEKTIAKKNQVVKGQKAVKVNNGKKDSVRAAFGQSVNLTARNGEESNPRFKVTLNKSLLNRDGQLEAPVKKGQKIGYATLSATDGAYGHLYKENNQVPVVAAEGVEKSSWIVRMFQGIGNFFAGIFSWIAGLF